MAKSGKHSGKHRTGEYGRDTPPETVSEISKHELVSSIICQVLGIVMVLGGVVVYVFLGNRGESVEAELGGWVKYKGVVSGLMVVVGGACIWLGRYKMKYRG